jgi:integrase
MDTLQQAELNVKQKAKLAEEAGWNPRIAPRDTSPDGSTAWRADWWEKDTRPNGERNKSGYIHKTKQFPTRKELVAWVQDEQRIRAKQRKLTKRAEKRGDSVVTLSHLSPAERAAIAQAVETIRKAGGRVEALADAAQSFASIQLTGAKKTVAEIVQEHLALLEKTARPATVRDRRWNLEAFAKQYGGELAAAITPTMINAFTLEIPKRPTQAARWRSVRALFNFAVAQGYMDEPPTERAKKIKQEIPDEISVLSPAEVQEVMRRALQMEPRLVPYLAIGIFAGLRPENELGRLDWDKINLKSRTITVTGKNAKTKKKRAVPISDNLAAWLETVPEAERAGEIYYYRRALRRVLGQEQAAKAEKRAELEAQAAREGRKLSGPTPDETPAPEVLRWGQDIMRHTFGSYRQAVIKNINQLCEEMGNTPHIARAHYLDPPDEEAAAEFWAITPASVTESKKGN